MRKLPAENNSEAQTLFCVDRCDLFIIPSFNASNNISECSLSCPDSKSLFGRYCLATCSSDQYLSETETVCLLNCSTGFYEERPNGKVCFSKKECNPG